MSHRDLLVIGDDDNITTNSAYYGRNPFDVKSKGTHTNPIDGWDNAPAGDPPWADGDIPDLNLYTELELFVAGRLSTMDPFAQHHPAWALPFARAALEATGDWEPSDA